MSTYGVWRVDLKEPHSIDHTRQHYEVVIRFAPGDHPAYLRWMGRWAAHLAEKTGWLSAEDLGNFLLAAQDYYFHGAAALNEVTQ